jgi:enoyl-CoA hydratase/carnithine racemase
VTVLQVMKEIVCAAQQHQSDESVGAIIITGEGTKAFAAGADIKEMANQSYSQVWCLLKTYAQSRVHHSCQFKCGLHCCVD